VIKLLVVDDSALMRRLLTGVFAGDQRFEVQTARDGLEALQRLRDFKPDVITLDLQMPQMDGLACLKRIMLERPCPVVIVSSLTEAGGVETLEALEADALDKFRRSRDLGCRCRQYLGQQDGSKLVHRQ
jgi:two-component system, chemotaxis family, protein-glutamate methylesterase/glutaminase